MRVLIAGVGYVGSALTESLREDGDVVFGLRRKLSEIPRGVHGIQADLVTGDGLSDLPKSLDVVVFTAAAEGSDEAAYRAIYVDGLRNLLEALESQGQNPWRIVFTSSTSVYGQRDGSWVDEESPAEPESFRGVVMLEAERMLLESPYPAVVLRLGGIYGPGRTRMIDMVRDGTARCYSGLVHYLNHQHRDDCAGALRHLLRISDPAAVYVGVDEEPAERNAVLRWIAQELEVEAPEELPFESAPEWLRKSKRCGNRRLREAGYRFLYPSYKEGYRILMDCMDPMDGMDK